MIEQQHKVIRKIFLVFSECDNSPQLLSIYKKCKQEIDSVKVLLILNPGTQLEKDLKEIGASFQRLAPTTKWLFWMYSMNIFYELLINRVEIVFMSGQSATITTLPAAVFARIPRRIFIRHHADFHHSRKMKIGYLADLISSRMATTIIAVSNLVQDILINTEKVPRKKVKVISNGFHVSDFLKVRERSKLNERQVTIGTVGRFTHLKGLQNVAEAFVELAETNSDVHLIMLGAPADETSNIKQILSKTDSSRYELLEKFHSMPDFYAKLDILVHAPIGPFKEAFGLVYLEALAAGCTCLFTKSGVLFGDTSFDGYYELAEFQNTESILKNLTKLLSPEISNSKTYAPSNLFTPYTIENMVNEYWRALQDA